MVFWRVRCVVPKGVAGCVVFLFYSKAYGLSDFLEEFLLKLSALAVFSMIILARGVDF